VADPLLEAKLTVKGPARGVAFSEPRGVAFDPRSGALYVANTGENRIDVFSAHGRPLARFIHRVSRPDGAKVDGRPGALAFDRSGRLLVVDHLATYVDVLDRRGHSLGRLNVPAGHPSAVAVAGDGTIYVGTTAEASAIHRFSPTCQPLGSWGVEGREPGHLNAVTAVGELADGNIAVACARTDLGIQIFTPAGEFVRGFGSHEMGAENFSLPCCRRDWWERQSVASGSSSRSGA
jgi:DNA-binding beta-propeller fold protein YncE